MTVENVRIIIFNALNAKGNLDVAAASVLQTQIEQFLILFKNKIGKNIDTASKKLEVPLEIEEAANELIIAHGI